MQLKSLVQNAFYASITREEGQDVRFSLLWSDPQLAAKFDWPRATFANEIPFNVESLRKLSPASDPERVDICAFSGDEIPQIWGLVFIRERSEGQKTYPPGLTLIVDSPGTLVIKTENRLVGTYSRGFGVLIEEGVHIDSVGIKQILAKIFSDERDFKEKIFSAARIIDFANEALVAGQGATILITMGNTPPEGVIFPKFLIDDASRKTLTEYLSNGDFQYLTKSLSRIALVDGAIVISEYGEIFGFGGMIQAAIKDDFQVVLVDSRNFNGSGKTISLSDFSGGSRHRSALAFCYENAGSAALVVSHDGIMSVMTRPTTEDRVLVVRPFLRTFDLGI